MSLIPHDMTPVYKATIAKGTSAARWQRAVYVDHLPPCNNACPAGENIQAWLALAQGGLYAEAWRKYMEENPLPAIHGRACYHPCEGACNRQFLDQPVAIHSIDRFLGDLALERGWTVEAVSSTGKRVLVIGAGPAPTTRTRFPVGAPGAIVQPFSIARSPRKRSSEWMATGWSRNCLLHAPSHG